MECQHFNRHIYNYCEGKVSPELRLTVEKHLSVCKSCHNHYRLTVLENEVLQNPDEIPALSPDFNARVMKAIRQQENLTTQRAISRPANKWWTRGKKISLSLTTCVALLLLCFHISGFNPWAGKDLQVKNPTPQSGQLQRVAQGTSSNTNFSKDSKSKNYYKPDREVAAENITNSPDRAAESDKDNIEVQVQNQDQTGSTQSAPQTVNDSLTSRYYGIDSGRAGSAEKAQSYAVLSPGFAIPANIPDRFRLVEQNIYNLDNRTVYEYISQDGSERLTIEETIAAEQTMQITSIDYGKQDEVNKKAPDEQPSLSTVNKNIKINGREMTVVFRSNIPYDDLVILAENTTFQ